MNSLWKTIFKPSSASASEEMVTLFESRIGCELPSDYRQFLVDFNGGEVIVEHRIPTKYDGESMELKYLLSLVPPDLRGSWGLFDSREVDEEYRFLNRSIVQIGDDGCVGLFYLVVDGPKKNEVYFGYKDDRRSVSESQWSRPLKVMPETLYYVAREFGDLPDLILRHKNVAM